MSEASSNQDLTSHLSAKPGLVQNTGKHALSRGSKVMLVHSTGSVVMLFLS
jgi:hypothetical protein